MTDPAPDDVRFEQRIRDVFADLAPATAPASLRAAVAAVPARGAGQAHGRARLLLAAMGLAAAVVVAIAGIGLFGGRLPVGARRRSSDGRRAVGGSPARRRPR